MVIETKKENLCINQNVGEKETIINVEGDIIIPDIKPDILNAINTSGNVCMYKKDILDGKIRYDGSVNIYVMYMPDGEETCVRGLNTNLDFTEIVDINSARTGMNSYEDIYLKSIECRVINGRKINLRATLQLSVKVYSNENIDLINDIQNTKDIQVLSKKRKFSSLIGEGSNKIYAKDTIKIDEIDNLAEILKTDFSIINKEIKVSYNKVLVKSDLLVEILYITEDNRISSVTANVPVMGFIDIPNVTEDNDCDTKYNIKNIIVKPNSVEEHSIYTEVQIEVSCVVFETKEINIIEDLYNPKENITYTEKNVNIVSEKNTYKDTYQINETVQIPELGNNKIYSVDIRTDILSENIINDKVVYEGEIGLNFLYESDNIVKLDAKKIKINFSYTMDLRKSNYK